MQGKLVRRLHERWRERRLLRVLTPEGRVVIWQQLRSRWVSWVRCSMSWGGGTIKGHKGAGGGGDVSVGLWNGWGLA